MPLKLLAYTDGACSGNPGPGGWGVVLQAFRNKKLIKQRELKGGAVHTTNNQMELTAAIKALEALKTESRIVLRTDSAYLRDGITKWIHDWKKKRWKTSTGRPVKNEELWKRLDELGQRHSVEWQWVKGHANDQGNERADELANLGMEPFKISNGK